MSVTTFDTPAKVMQRLADIESDLAERQNELEDAARDWFRAKRDREKQYAESYMGMIGTDGARKAHATLESRDIGVDAEAKWEGLKAVVRVLEARATVGQSILRAQGRA